MSNTDSFIDEVSEEVRRDRLFKVYKKYGWILVVLVVAIVGGAAWNEYSKANRIAQSEAAGRALQAANEAGDAALLNDLANSNSDTAVIAQLQQAAILAGADDAEGAKAILSGISTSNDAPGIYRDLALLKLLMLDAANMPDTDVLAALDALATPGAPFRLLALEQRALHYVRKGETDAAITTLAEIVNAADASDALRQRAQELTIALGGSLDAANNG
ncbi:DUF2659 family protein [Abyssibius alkaniclasticus]|uniref:DUF2659 family protein n=1 Tax=Abyssibius alkaniclasticus TaxID=2881234 RepID=UPI00405A17AC